MTLPDTGVTTEMQRLRHAHEVSLPARSMVDQVITHPVFVGMCLIGLCAMPILALLVVFSGH